MTPAATSLTGPSQPDVLERVGRRVLDGARIGVQLVDFLGEVMIGIGRLLRGRTLHRDVRFTAALQQAGVGTLPIVALFATAAGLVLMLLALQQLDKVGVPGIGPRLVGIVILRELGALMTGIALAGRVASGFAAEIATATARGETEQMQAMGFAPIDVLAAPRVLAAAVAGPLLVAYANALALLGGTLIGMSMTDASFSLLFEQTLSALNFKHGIAGLSKGVLFGFLSGMAAAWHGLRATRDAVTVGRQVRNAAVSAAVGVALADLVLTFVFKWIRL